MKLVKHTNNNSEQISKYCKRHILRLVIIIEQFFFVLVNNYIEPKVLRLLGFTSSDDIFMNMIKTMNWTISHWSRKVLLTNEKNCAEKFTFRDLVKYLKTVQTKSKEKNLNLNQIHKLKEGRDFKEKIDTKELTIYRTVLNWIVLSQKHLQQIVYRFEFNVPVKY